uniref:PKD domain-containing protein n=1 Tax=Anisakis simplex TaxID=6269 RepID=A0A0M3KE07_ANISI
LLENLKVNLYNGSRVDLGRADAISVYSDDSFTELLHRFTPSTKDFSLSVQSNSKLTIHVRASAADGEYGFLAEIVVLPSVPQRNPVEEIVLHQSRIEENDRGAISYRNTGEMGPNIIWAQLRSTSITHNIGGLLVTSETSSAVARLVIVIRDSALMHNSNSTTLALLGNNYQKATLLNNLISRNYALYQDIVFIRGISTNFTHNLFSNNTGLHIVDTQPYSSLSTESQAFYNNWFYDNIALGHGHQYMEDYGFQPENLLDDYSRRPKRQVLDQDGVSFDWWTHVGGDTQRYRSTVFAGTSRQTYRMNSFNNPLNPYELTTAPVTNFDAGVIDARENYWGYPGTIGVASGKIRDGLDYDYLIRVDYQPVLESNTSLIDGDCPAGWFAAGYDEFRSCFLYVGAAATYTSAVKFCEEMDAFVPFLRADDGRQTELAQKVNEITKISTVDGDRFNSYPVREYLRF